MCKIGGIATLVKTLVKSLPGNKSFGPHSAVCIKMADCNPVYSYVI